MQVHIMTFFLFCQRQDPRKRTAKKNDAVQFFTNLQCLHLFSFIQVRHVHVQGACGNAFAGVAQRGTVRFSPVRASAKKQKNKTVAINELCMPTHSKGPRVLLRPPGAASPQRSLVLHLRKDVT